MRDQSSRAGNLARLVTLLSLAVLFGCDAADRSAFSSAPVIVRNPNPRAPLAAILSFTTRAPVSTVVRLSDGEHSWDIAFDETDDPSAGLTLLGLRPARVHEVEVTVTDAGGNEETAAPLHYETPPLPTGLGDFAPLDVKVSQPELMEPGNMFLSVRRRFQARNQWVTPSQRSYFTNWGLIVAVDNEGEVVWYYESDTRVAGINKLSNGNLQYHLTDFRTVELDMLGNVVAEYYAGDRPEGPAEGGIPILGAQTLHHQPFEMPSGTFLAFSANAREIEDYYTSDSDPDAPRETQLVMGDSIIEFDSDGEIVWTWDAWNHLDPFRIGYDTLEPYWHVRGFPDHADWTHGNGLTYDASDDSVIINLKHQDALFKIDRATGEIVWILGEHTDWPETLQSKLLTPVGDNFQWMYHGHNPRLTGRGTIVIYDNAAFQARPFDTPDPVGDTYSRTVEFEVDEEDMTVRQVWASHAKGDPDSCATPAMGDAHWLPETGNIFVVDSFCDYREEGLAWDSWDFGQRHWSEVAQWARIRQYRLDGEDTEIVFEMEVHEPAEILQWRVFGGFHTPSLYQL
ncbi:MAG: aryl-sulfate sulfotransferase [Candidatus Rariloculaceae bacterium]